MLETLPAPSTSTQRAGRGFLSWLPSFSKSPRVMFGASHACALNPANTIGSNKPATGITCTRSPPSGPCSARRGQPDVPRRQHGLDSCCSNSRRCRAVGNRPGRDLFGSQGAAGRDALGLARRVDPLGRQLWHARAGNPPTARSARPGPVRSTSLSRRSNRSAIDRARRSSRTIGQALRWTCGHLAFRGRARPLSPARGS